MNIVDNFKDWPSTIMGCTIIIAICFIVWVKPDIDHVAILGLISGLYNIFLAKTR